MSNRITDLSFFEQNSFGDKALYRELLSIFARTTPEMVSQMQQAFSNNDYDQLAKLAHKLKSNVKSVGLDRAYDCLSEVENLNPGSIDKEKIAGVLKEVYSYCAKAKEEVAAELEHTK